MSFAERFEPTSVLLCSDCDETETPAVWDNLTGQHVAYCDSPVWATKIARILSDAHKDY